MQDSINPIYQALQAAKRQLRDCYWFRRLADEFNAWDESTAESHIYFDELPPSASGQTHTRGELELLRPFALIWLDPQNGMSIENETAGGCWTTRGIITILIEIEVPEQMQWDPDNLAVWLHQRLGRIIRTGSYDQPGLADLSLIPGYLPFNRIQFRGYVRADSATAVTQGDCVICEIEAEWGSR